MATKRDQWAARLAECTEWSILGPSPDRENVVDRVWYCAGAKEVDQIVHAWCANVDSHARPFSCGCPDLMKYGISLPYAERNRQNPALRQTAMTDPSDWAGDLSAESGPCQWDFDLISQEIANIYEDEDRCHAAVITLMQEYIQLAQESVRAYVNHVKANCRQARCNLQKHEEVLNDIAWAGLRNTLKHKVGPMTPGYGRLVTLDKFFDKAATSEATHVDNKKPHRQQQQQQQQQQKQPTDCSSKGGKRGYRTSIAQPADPTGSKFGQLGSDKHRKSGDGGQSSAWPPALCVPKKRIDNWHCTAKCVPCRTPNHEAIFCAKYSRGGNPLQQDQTLAANRDGRHRIKR